MTELAPKDACDLLDADHIAVKHLFVEYARLAMAAPAAAAEREPIARRICSELTVHAQIEEEIFYPALREVVDDASLLDEAEAEHQEAKAMIARIEAAAPGPEKDDLVSQLARAIEHHVRARLPERRKRPGGRFLSGARGARRLIRPWRSCAGSPGTPPASAAAAAGRSAGAHPPSWAAALRGCRRRGSRASRTATSPARPWSRPSSA